MLVQTLSTFPGMFASVMGESMMKRAQEKGIISYQAFDLRDWTYDRHRTTDDYPYGGGDGLLMKCEPIFEAVEDILAAHPAEAAGADQRIVFMSPCGRRFDDAYACELAQADRILFVCGHYEGIDERAYSLATDMVSLGDYVLTSGELAAMVVIDAVARKLPGVLGAAGGADDESYAHGLLEYPQYTRPAVFRDMAVPDVLLSGHHANIEAWRRHQSLARTFALRPDLIEQAACDGTLTVDDLHYLDSLEATHAKAPKSAIMVPHAKGPGGL